MLYIESEYLIKVLIRNLSFSHKAKEHFINEVKNKLSFTEFYGVSKELVLKDKNNINIKSNKDVFCFKENIDFKVNLIGFKL